MDILAVVEQIKSISTVFSGNVAAASSMEVALDKAPTSSYPFAFVVPQSDECGENTSQNSYDQDIIETFSVFVIADNRVIPSDRRGQNAATTAYTIRAALWAALLNWRLDYDRSARGLWYVGYGLFPVDLARVVHEYRFSQRIHVTEDDGYQPVTVPLTEIDIIEGNANADTSIIVEL